MPRALGGDEVRCAVTDTGIGVPDAARPRLFEKFFRAENVSKVFGGLVAVEDVSFTIPERGIVSIIGPNGAGKTTFFNMLTGLYKPSFGRISFDGRNITGRGLRSSQASSP